MRELKLVYPYDINKFITDQKELSAFMRELKLVYPYDINKFITYYKELC